jgi:hypothetical protein
LQKKAPLASGLSIRQAISGELFLHAKHHARLERQDARIDDLLHRASSEPGDELMLWQGSGASLTFRRSRLVVIGASASGERGFAVRSVGGRLTLDAQARDALRVFLHGHSTDVEAL